MASTMVEVCAFAGTGNVLRVQRLLHICSEHHEPQEKEDRKESKETAAKKDESAAGAAASGSATGTSTAASAVSSGAQADLSSQQAVAVIGLALIGMGEDIGAEMAFRTLGHLLRYGEPCIRRAVPLALGLISVSNPRLNVLDTLSKFSHDSDSEVALNSILALGLVGAGTNNARYVNNNSSIPSLLLLTM
jgi:26S proteasome regulatory subunit N1